MRVTDRHDMAFAVKVALNPNTTNQPSEKKMFQSFTKHSFNDSGQYTFRKYSRKRKKCST